MSEPTKEKLLSSALLNGILALLSNIRLGLEDLPVTNSVAYYKNS